MVVAHGYARGIGTNVNTKLDSVNQNRQHGGVDGFA